VTGARIRRATLTPEQIVILLKEAASGRPR